LPAARRPGLLADALSTISRVEGLAGRSVDPALLERAIELESAHDELPLDDSPTADHGAMLMLQFEIDQARETFLALLARALDHGDEANVSACSSIFRLSSCSQGPRCCGAVRRGVARARGAVGSQSHCRAACGRKGACLPRRRRGRTPARRQGTQAFSRGRRPYFFAGALAIRVSPTFRRGTWRTLLGCSRRQVWRPTRAASATLG